MTSTGHPGPLFARIDQFMAFWGHFWPQWRTWGQFQWVQMAPTDHPGCIPPRSNQDLLRSSHLEPPKPLAQKCHKTGISGHRLLRWLQMAGSQCMRSLEKREHGLVHIWCIVILARCTYSASLVNYIFCGMYVWCYASSVRWFFGALHL